MQKFAKHVAEGLVRAILPLPIRSRRAALPCPVPLLEWRCAQTNG